jgi:hypothetical protein
MARNLLGPVLGHFEEQDMPNRGELAMPVQPVQFEAKDAWMVIGFCSIGWLMSIGLAASTLSTLPRLPW